MTSPGEALRGGALNAEISNAIVRLLSDTVGRGPTKARTIHSGKIVLCVLEDTMTKAELSLATSGKEDLVLTVRRAFQETMEGEMSSAIETLTGRNVVAFMSANHVGPDLAAEVFILDEPLNGAAVGSNTSDPQEQDSPISGPRDGDQQTEDGSISSP